MWPSEIERSFKSYFDLNSTDSYVITEFVGDLQTNNLFLTQELKQSDEDAIWYPYKSTLDLLCSIIPED